MEPVEDKNKDNDKNEDKNRDEDILITKFDSSVIKKNERVTRKEVIKHCIRYLVEERGILYRGEYRKGTMVDDDGTGRLVFNFGVGDQEAENNVKIKANEQVMLFMAIFNEKWKKDFGDSRTLSKQETAQFLTSICK